MAEGLLIFSDRVGRILKFRKSKLGRAIPGGLKRDLFLSAANNQTKKKMSAVEMSFCFNKMNSAGRRRGSPPF